MVVRELVAAVKELASYHVKSPAAIVQLADGDYIVIPYGVPGREIGRYVISRGQLGVLMWEHRFGRRDLADPKEAARLAALVAEY